MSDEKLPPDGDPSKVSCPRCRRGPGMLCRDPLGRPADMHQERIRKAEAPTTPVPWLSTPNPLPWPTRDMTREESRIARERINPSPAEQPSGNTGGLPATTTDALGMPVVSICGDCGTENGAHSGRCAARKRAEGFAPEAPAAPVAEPLSPNSLEWKLKDCQKRSNDRMDFILDLEAQIAALEAELAASRRAFDEATAINNEHISREEALEAELSEAKSKLVSQLADALGESNRIFTAVQAERERCAFHVKSAVNKSIGYRTALERIGDGTPKP